MPHKNIYIVSLNNLAWLLEQDHGADGIIIDELSKASGKQAAGLRSKKKADRLVWRVGMTATPVSQDYEKLYSMARIIDRGKALGINKEKYLNEYFYPDYNGYNWTLRDDAAPKIMSKIKSLVHLVEDTKAEDLPALTDDIVIRFDMPIRTRELYDTMKKEMVAGDVEAANEAVKSGKLRQLASGFLYSEDDEAALFDTERNTAALRWVKKLGGRKGIIFYEFKAQLLSLSLALVDVLGHSPAMIFGGMSKNAAASNMESFTHGFAQVMLAQINTLSHGVDGLQNVCHDALFFQPMWSRDATEQAVGRLWRTGQTSPVSVTTLVCDKTLDDLVLARVEDRGEFMKLFVKHLRGDI